MTKRKQNFIRGAGTHRRTEDDYMGVLLDAVSLDDWRDVVAETLQLAKQGDPQARAWLAHYLVGRPEAKAPTPMTVVVNQWAGRDPVAERLAKPLIDRERFPACTLTTNGRQAYRTQSRLNWRKSYPHWTATKANFPNDFGKSF